MDLLNMSSPELSVWALEKLNIYLDPTLSKEKMVQEMIRYSQSVVSN